MNPNVSVNEEIICQADCTMYSILKIAKQLNTAINPKVPWKINIKKIEKNKKIIPTEIKIKKNHEICNKSTDRSIKIPSIEKSVHDLLSKINPETTSEKD